MNWLDWTLLLLFSFGAYKVGYYRAWIKLSRQHLEDLKHL